MDDSRNQQFRVYTNALEFATAVDDGVDSHFLFDNDPGAEIEGGSYHGYFYSQLGSRSTSSLVGCHRRRLTVRFQEV
jgi:hypothetical protein